MVPRMQKINPVWQAGGAALVVIVNKVPFVTPKRINFVNVHVAIVALLALLQLPR